MRVTFRRAGADDLPVLNAITQSSSAYEGRYRAILEGYVIDAAQVARDLVFLAEREGAALGYYSLIAEPEPELDLLFVIDAAQGEGVGALMVAHIRETAAAQGWRSLRIVSHPPALGFYERMGAVLIGAKPASGAIGYDRPILVLITLN
jgi:GNAT superfamily N-acetyltransferase